MSEEQLDFYKVLLENTKRINELLEFKAATMIHMERIIGILERHAKLTEEIMKKIGIEMGVKKND